MGDWIFIGGDVSGGSGDQFLTAVNNGFKRIRAIAAGYLEFDKSATTMATEPSTLETVRIFWGRILKNRSGSSIVRRTYQLERTLGAPDDASPAQIQAEYVVGAVGNEAVFNIAQADKINVDLTWVGGDTETIDGPTALKAGTRPTLTEGTAFNTSSDFTEIKLAPVVSGNENPDALFSFLTDLTVTLNNNITPNKAVSVLGAFDVSAGTFQVSASATAYFASEQALEDVRDNLDFTLHMHIVKENKGVTIDLPLVAISDARIGVEQDSPVTLPITMEAATGAKNNVNQDHTMLMVFWDYLPTSADS